MITSVRAASEDGEKVFGRCCHLLSNYHSMSLGQLGQRSSLDSSGSVSEVDIGAGGDEQRGQEAEELTGEQQVHLLVVEDGEQLQLGCVLGVDQAPEVGHHPHGRGGQDAVLSLHHCLLVYGAREVSLQHGVVVDHEVIPEDACEQSLKADTSNNYQRLSID